MTESTHTLLSALSPDTLPSGRLRRGVRLFAEAVVHTLAAQLIAAWTGIPQGGFFSLFLSTAALSRRFDQLLDENRQAIYERKEPSPRVNARTAASLLALFLGMLTAYAGAALLIGEAHLRDDFGFVLEVAGLGSDTLSTRRFGSVPGLLLHNGLVLLTFFVLALVYRGYGALLALSWNACVWGMVLTLLAHRGAQASRLSGLLYVPLSAAAVLPHLLLEVVGYVLGSLAGIFLSKALARYRLDDPLVAEVSRVAMVLLGLALGLLGAAALLEARWAPFVLGAG